MRACETFLVWSRIVQDDDGDHEVRLVTPEDPRLGVRFGYGCDCDGSQPCVHVLYAQGWHCGWHSVFFKGLVPDGEACPQCGGRLVNVPYVP